MHKNHRTATVLIASAILAVPPALAQFELSWWSIDGGGGTSTGGNFELFGTISQPDANPVVITGGNFALTGGFWSVTVGAPPPACPGDFDCDGDRDFDDIDPFVEALNTGKCKCPRFANCDPNGDGKITFDDIDAFVPLLGVPCP